MIQVPERQHDLDRLAREVADAALAEDRERRGTYRDEWPSRLSSEAYRRHFALLRYELATRTKEKA